MNKFKSQPASISRNSKPDMTSAGGGTLLILLAQSLPPTYDYKQYLVTAAPAVTTVLTYLWGIITKEFSILKKERKTKKKEKIVTKLMDQLMNNPNISSHIKELLKEQWEKFQLALIQEQIRELNELRELT